MITPAISLKDILATITVLYSLIVTNGQDFFTSLDDEVSLKYLSESITIVKTNEITDIKEKFTQLERSNEEMKLRFNQFESNLTETLTKMHNSFTQLEATLTELKTMQITTTKPNSKDMRNALSSDKTKITNTSANSYSIDECPGYRRTSEITLQMLNSTKVLCNEVRCKQWIVVYYRASLFSNIFYQTWSIYQKGFGRLDDDFFIGLDNLHLLTNTKPHELLVELEYTGGLVYAHYDNFLIGNASEDYIVKNIGEYSGELIDSFEYSNGSKFSTFDRDNDDVKDVNCALLHSAWWHGTKCYQRLYLNWAPMPKMKLMIRPRDEKSN